MQRESWTWTTTRLPEPARVVRWGHFGTPVLLFPSAGGDFEEVERCHLVGALRHLIDAGRMKVFSVDGSAMRAWLRGSLSPQHCASTQSSYEAYIDAEVVPLIRRDCHGDTIEIIAAGCALGAHSALSALCRYPEVFRAAIGVSGLYDLARLLTAAYPADLRSVLPLYSLHELGESSHAQNLRRRSVLLATGEGDYERPDESRRMAAALGAGRVNHQLEMWGTAFAHSWHTWREMLPRYLAAHV